MDARCPGRRLYAWDTTHFGTAEKNELFFTNVEIVEFANQNILAVCTDFENSRTISIPINQREIDISGQVSRNCQGRLDASDLLKIDTLNDWENRAENLLVQSSSNSDLTGIQVCSQSIESIYSNGHLLAQSFVEANDEKRNYEIADSMKPFRERAEVYTQADLQNSETFSIDEDDEKLFEECRVVLENDDNEKPEKLTNTSQTDYDYSKLLTEGDSPEFESEYHSKLYELWGFYKRMKIVDID